MAVSRIERPFGGRLYTMMRALLFMVYLTGSDLLNSHMVWAYTIAKLLSNP